MTCTCNRLHIIKFKNIVQYMRPELYDFYSFSKLDFRFTSSMGVVIAT